MLSVSPIAILGSEKNNAKSIKKYHRVDDELAVEVIKPSEKGNSQFKCEPDASLIQYYFAVGGEASLSFFGGRYKRTLAANYSLLIYQPNQKMAFDLELEESTQLVCLFIHVQRLHRLFTHDLGALPFLESEQINQKFYEERLISNNLGMVLSQLLNGAHIPSNEMLYFQAKSLEILSFYFHQSEEDEGERCPFLLDENKVSKIRMAKQIIQDRMLDPPTLKGLAKEIGLNEYQLKVGFKNIYGKSVYQHLGEYKMQVARRLLDQQNLRVNEVSDQIGYSNPSHFIVAFKRQFGVTPKKYLMSLR
ncbi:MAG: helix-turn-helix transcriptional regulator [Bacteroidota bacterium]